MSPQIGQLYSCFCALFPPFDLGATRKTLYVNSLKGVLNCVIHQWGTKAKNSFTRNISSRSHVTQCHSGHSHVTRTNKVISHGILTHVHKTSTNHVVSCKICSFICHNQKTIRKLHCPCLLMPLESPRKQKFKWQGDIPHLEQKIWLEQRFRKLLLYTLVRPSHQVFHFCFLCTKLCSLSLCRCRLRSNVEH